MFVKFDIIKDKNHNLETINVRNVSKFDILRGKNLEGNNFIWKTNLIILLDGYSLQQNQACCPLLRGTNLVNVPSLKTLLCFSLWTLGGCQVSETINWNFLSHLCRSLYPDVNVTIEYLWSFTNKYPQVNVLCRFSTIFLPLVRNTKRPKQFHRKHQNKNITKK